MTLNIKNSIDVMEKYIQELTVEYATKKNLKERFEEELTHKTKELEAIMDYIDVLEQVRILLQRTSEYAREQIKQQIEMLVTHCLQFVFGPNLEFAIRINSFLVSVP